MDTALPKNSINTPLDLESNELFRLQKENERVRENNLKLKLQLIEEKEKLYKILEIINKPI